VTYVMSHVNSTYAPQNVEAAVEVQVRGQ
jgi:hypothetical protein